MCFHPQDGVVPIPSAGRDEDSLEREKEKTFKFVIVYKGYVSAYWTFEISNPPGMVLIVYSPFEVLARFAHIKGTTWALQEVYDANCVAIDKMFRFPFVVAREDGSSPDI